ncbi:MAG: hypothetical protein ACYS0G_03640 [Planctomycetota bacterium]
MTALVVIQLSLAAGCTAGRGPGSLRAESLGRDPVFLSRPYVTAFYADHESTETSFFLSDVPVQELLGGDVGRANIVRLDLLWIPHAGATPMDSSATNASVRYIVIADGEVGVYGGAGFALPLGETGRRTLSLTVRDASLTLLDSTDGFVDLLSPARLTGTITATLDTQRVGQIHDAVRRLVANALGRSRHVDGPRRLEPHGLTRPSTSLSEVASTWRPKDP